MRWLEKRPEQRYATVEEFVEALRRAALGARRRGSAVVLPGEAPARAPAPSLGVAVYVDIRMHVEGDEIDGAVADAGFILDLAEDRLREHGFVVVQTGNSAIGLRALPTAPAANLAARGAAIEAAAALHEHILTREGGDPRVHANVCVHVDGLHWRPGGEISGGPLVRTEAWAPRGDVLALCATTAAVDGVTGFDFVAGPTLLVTAGGEGAAPTTPLVTVTRRL